MYLQARRSGTPDAIGRRSFTTHWRAAFWVKSFKAVVIKGKWSGGGGGGGGGAV